MEVFVIIRIKNMQMVRSKIPIAKCYLPND